MFLSGTHMGCGVEGMEIWMRLCLCECAFVCVRVYRMTCSDCIYASQMMAADRARCRFGCSFRHVCYQSKCTGVAVTAAPHVIVHPADQLDVGCSWHVSKGEVSRQCTLLQRPQYAQRCQGGKAGSQPDNVLRAQEHSSLHGAGTGGHEGGERGRGVRKDTLGRASRQHHAG